MVTCRPGDHPGIVPPPAERLRIVAHSVPMRVQLLSVLLGIVATAGSTTMALAPAASAAIGGVEAATRQMLAGQQPAADAAMRRTLDRWVASSTRLTTVPADGSLEADVLAIRDVVFRPMGDRVLRGEWNAEGWPATEPAYLVAPARIEVRVASGRPASIDVSRQPPGLTTVVFATDHDVRALSAIVTRLGGGDRGEPGGLMDVPNQPADRAVRIIEWWNAFFPCRAGHWEGAEVESAPVVDAIEFTDAGRTHARVKVRIGYAGATVLLDKVDGTWTMRSLVDQWVM